MNMPYRPPGGPPAPGQPYPGQAQGGGWGPQPPQPGYPQPQQGHPPAQQGYPQAQQGYPQQPPQGYAPAPQGYAQQPQQGHAPAPQGYAPPGQGYGVPPQQGNALAPQGQGQFSQPHASHGQGGGTVFGVPLENGERVFYFFRPPRASARIFGFILGLFMLPVFGLGLYFWYLVIVDRSQSIYAQVLTNRRMLGVNGKGQPRIDLRWEQMAGLNKVIRNGVPSAFGVRNGIGAKFMFVDDLFRLEHVLTQALQQPSLRESAPEVPYPPRPD